jgi:hypothetical protein
MCYTLVKGDKKMEIKVGHYWGLENSQFTLIGITYYKNYGMSNDLIFELFNFYIEFSVSQGRIE